MKMLYLDCAMGAAGDMLTAALLELLPEPEQFVDELNALGIPGVTFRRVPAEKCGIRGTQMSVLVDGQEGARRTTMHRRSTIITIITSTAACGTLRRFWKGCRSPRASAHR